MKNVLVVDDTKNIRIMLKTCLEIMGFSVHDTSSGKEAFELVKEEAFDAAFIDIKMPEMSGTELLKKIRNMGLDFPIVIMTAFPTVKNAIDCTKLGAVAYLQKPFSKDKIINLIQNLDIMDSIADEKDISLRSIGRMIEREEYEEAEKQLKKIIGMNPQNGDAYYCLSRISRHNEDLEEEAKLLRVAEIFGYTQQ